MRSAITILLVGGPGDGQLVDMPPSTPYIQYMVPRSGPDLDEHGESDYTPTNYYITQLVLFNRIIYVGVHESVSPEAKCDAVARSMLSETGNLLRSKAEPLHPKKEGTK